MKKVVIASTNPVKVEVAQRAFATLYPHEVFTFTSEQSDSAVPDQPYDDDTRRGADNRLSYVMRLHPDADFWISQEGGLYREGAALYNQAWIVVQSADGAYGRAATARMYLPTELVRLVHSGMELGHAGNAFFNEQNIKHGAGVIGYLTNGSISRADYYTQAAILALGQIVHKEWYDIPV